MTPQGNRFVAKPDVMSGNPPSPSLPAAEAIERMAASAQAQSGPASVVILMVQETSGQFVAVSYKKSIIWLELQVDSCQGGRK